MFTLARIFSDNIIFQAKKPIHVWGTSDETVTACLGAAVIKAEPKDGVWLAEFAPIEPCENINFCVKGSESEISVKNAAVGEVWIAGGQSNMEFALRHDAEREQVIAEANDGFLRFYDVPKISCEESEECEDYSPFGVWRDFTPENAPYFSAAAAFFGMVLRQKLEVPVAIVGCNWGGTSASTWLGEESLEANEKLRIYIDEYVKSVKTLDLETYDEAFKKEKMAMQDPRFQALMDKVLRGEFTNEQIAAYVTKFEGLSVPVGPRHPNRPGALYKHMVRTIAPLTARGVIWYQGESDSRHADIYAELFSAVIADWRKTFGYDIPFLFVQLAPFGRDLTESGDNFPEIRAQQEFVSKTVPMAYMVSIMDAGDENDIHPKRKRPVGERLALMALGKVYAGNLICEPPELVEAIRTDFGVRLRFNQIVQISKGDKISSLEALSLMNAETPVQITKAHVHDETIDIYADADIGEVRFAWSGYAKVNLYNKAGLPAKPFKVIVRSRENEI
jgi:sialate O-acetylesterase